MQRVIDFFTMLAKLFAGLVTFIVLIATAIILIKQLTDDVYLVEPIQVPPSFVSNGYTPEVTARWVVDRMLEIKREAATQKKDELPIAPDADRFDMEVPGSGMTLDTIAQALRESLGFRENTITGEIVSMADGFRSRLRLTGVPRYSQKTVTVNAVDAMITAAAESAVQLSAPFTYAAYLYGKGRNAELDNAIDYCLSHCQNADRAWALNLQGIAFDERGKLAMAAESYARAVKEAPRFAIAYHNWANTLYEQQDYETALEKYRRAVRLEPRFRDASKEAGYLLGWARKLMGDQDFRGAVEKFEKMENVLMSAKGKTMPAVLPEMYATWGLVLEKLGDNEAAIARYRQALQYDEDGYGYLKKRINTINGSQAR